jgi:nucleotide-binding universal stress UspA family protein
MREAERPPRVLLATDGSGDAKAAAAWVHSLPLPTNRVVMVITVVNPPRIAYAVSERGDLRGALVAEARRLADATAAELMTTRAVGRVVEGDPRHEIVAAARQWPADLIVLGARGLGAVARFLLGSVSIDVARHAPCPVLVCKGAPREIRTVTIAVDGSAHARRAVEWVAAHPLPAATRVRLVGVVESEHVPSSAPGRVGALVREAVEASARERRVALEGSLADAAIALKGRVTTVETVVGAGAPAAVIVEDAERHASDLVVMGARGLGTVERLWLGSVSESVLHHAGCPVLVVRPSVEGMS